MKKIKKVYKCQKCGSVLTPSEVKLKKCLTCKEKIESKDLNISYITIDIDDAELENLQYSIKTIPKICPNCKQIYKEDLGVYCPKCNTRLALLDDIYQTNDTDVSYSRVITPRNTQPTKPTQPAKPTVTCPYCGSTDTKKISATSRVIDSLVWGLFSPKRSKQWHCNKCKSDF